MFRVTFIAGAVAGVLSVPLPSRADDPSPAPSAEPSPVASGQPSPAASAKPQHRSKHIHGANGVVTIPEHRTLEWTSEVLDGPEFRLSAYRGKVAFANVFATWCGPCRHEQPSVVAFAEAHADDTVVFGVDVGEEDNDVRAYRKKYGIPYPIAMDRYDKHVRSIYREGKMVFPTTIVFRPDGTLSCAWEGMRDRAWFEAEREAALEPIVTTSPAPPKT